MQSVIGAMSVNDKEDGTSQQLIERLSTHQFRATFLNGKEIDVEYIYDRKKLLRDRVQVNLQRLAPVCGEFVSPDGIKFVGTFGVEDFLKTNLNLHECGSGIHTPCSNLDSQAEEKEDICPFDHFHHYCPEHVDAWFKYYLTAAIMLRERDYAELVKLEKPRNADYLMVGDRPTPEYWLGYAQRKGCGLSRKSSEKLLGQTSTREFEATFLNGKKIEVEYIYDRNVLDGGRVKINLQGLSPVFGGITLPDGIKFVSTSDLQDFLKKYMDLHECADGIYTPCSNLDGGLENEMNECPHNHFHHYCPEHVDAWFKCYLPAAIMLREGDYATVMKSKRPRDVDYLNTGDRPTPEYWLRYAQRRGCGFCRNTSQKVTKELAIHKFQATFFNGKEIEVEYTYNRERLHGDRVKVNLQGLLPVFGGIFLPDGEKFGTMSVVHHVLSINPSLHKCGDGIYTPCSNLDANLKKAGDECPYDHFHHYCQNHVKAWFDYYLTTAIVLREGDYVELMKLERPGNADYLTTGDRSTSKYWLRYAQRRGCSLSRETTSQGLSEQLASQKFQACFLNGKEIEVEYTYDRDRLHRDRVKINVQGFLQVFDWITPPGEVNFVNIFDVEFFLKKSLEAYSCCEGIFTPCSNLVSDMEESECPYNHFHHYCPEHVVAWFKYYLYATIMLREGDYAELMKLERPRNADYLTTGDRPTPQYWLHYAKRKGCGCSRKIISQGPKEMLPTRKLQVPFLNNKEIQVEYMYKQLHKVRIFINIQALTPVFNGMMPPNQNKYQTIQSITDFLKKNLDLHECSNGMYTPCSNFDDDLKETEEEEVFHDCVSVMDNFHSNLDEDLKEKKKCPYNHFHHYCPEHVIAWLKYYVGAMILFREGDYDNVMRRVGIIDRLPTGKSATSKHWLHMAHHHGCGLPQKQL